jgi:hypothetical protein
VHPKFVLTDTISSCRHASCDHLADHDLTAPQAGSKLVPHILRCMVGCDLLAGRALRTGCCCLIMAQQPHMRAPMAYVVKCGVGRQLHDICYTNRHDVQTYTQAQQRAKSQHTSTVLLSAVDSAHYVTRNTLPKASWFRWVPGIWRPAVLQLLHVEGNGVYALLLHAAFVRRWLHALHCTAQRCTSLLAVVSPAH